MPPKRPMSRTMQQGCAMMWVYDMPGWANAAMVAMLALLPVALAF